MHSSDHWENVYRSKPFDAVSWYAPHLGESLRLIQKLCPDPMASIIDIGGGESTLVDDLLQQQYRDVSVLDISATAIDFTRQRLGLQAQQVDWHVGDITQYDFGGQQFDLWHDRAVFHFLTALNSSGKFNTSLVFGTSMKLRLNLYLLSLVPKRFDT